MFFEVSMELSLNTLYLGGVRGLGPYTVNGAFLDHLLLPDAVDRRARADKAARRGSRRRRPGPAAATAAAAAEPVLAARAPQQLSRQKTACLWWL